MNKLLFSTARALPAAFVFAAAAVLSTGAHADDASKRALAVKLAQLQQKNDAPALADQLTDSAIQPVIAKWMPQIEARVAADKQKDVRDKLDAELKKFGDNTHKAVEAQAAKTAQDALVPVFLDKLSEDDMKIIVAYLQTSASAKFAAMGGDAAKAWVSQIVNGSQNAVQGYAKTFDAAADKIVSAAAGGSGSGSPSGLLAPASGAGGAKK